MRTRFAFFVAFFFCGCSRDAGFVSIDGQLYRPGPQVVDLVSGMPGETFTPADATDRRLIVFRRTATSSGDWFSRSEQQLQFGDRWLRDGLVVEQFADGSKSVETYVAGQLSGRSTFFWPSGQVRSTQDFVGGKRDGDWISYTRDGQVESASRWKNGVEIPAAESTAKAPNAIPQE